MSKCNISMDGNLRMCDTLNYTFEDKVQPVNGFKKIIIDNELIGIEYKLHIDNDIVLSYCPFCGSLIRPIKLPKENVEIINFRNSNL